MISAVSTSFCAEDDILVSISEIDAICDESGKIRPPLLSCGSLLRSIGTTRRQFLSPVRAR